MSAYVDPRCSWAAANAGVAALTTVHALELKRMGVLVNAVSPSMVRTRPTERLPRLDAPLASEGFDPRDPARIAEVVAYLASSACAVTGQMLAVRGSAVSVLNGWAPGESIDKSDAAWTPAELADALLALPMDDSFERLTAALGALGAGGREQVEKMVAAQLERS